MRAPAILVLLLASGLRPLAPAQEADSRHGTAREDSSNVCERSTHNDSDPWKVRVVDVRFQRVSRLAVQAQEKLAAELQEREYDGPEWWRAVCEHARAGWQTQGFFLFEPYVTYERVGGDVRDAKLAITLDGRNEGERYRLGKLTFQNAHAFKPDELQPLLAIREGDILDVEQIVRGLEILRDAYRRRGSINVTAVPDTVIDKQLRTVSLVIDVDEGKLFRWRTITIRGAPPELEKQMRAWCSARLGKPVDTDEIGLFFNRYAKLMPVQPVRPIEEAVEIKRDEPAGYIDAILTLGVADEVFTCGP